MFGQIPEVLADGANDLFKSMPQDEQARCNARAMQLFIAGKFFGLFTTWPETVQELDDHQIGVLRGITQHLRTLDDASRI